jgi:hypothetical protein
MAMKKLFFIIIASILYYSSFANKTLIDSIPVNSEDISSINAIITAVYDVISGPAGQKRNWDRMRTLFIPEAHIIAIGKRANGELTKRVMTVEEYINNSGPFLEKEGFFEKEIGRKTEEYGNIVHLFSTYESRRTPTDEKPFMRGINSFQLWNDGKRWWVVNIFWQSEGKDNPIPEKYVGKNN